MFSNNYPSIINATALPDNILKVELDNDTYVLLDFKALIQKIPGYAKLSNKAFFSTVKFDDDMVYWDLQHDMHIHQILDFGEIYKK